MDEQRDDIDTWLHERVRPLLPPPGTFEQVRKRARRRKLAQAAGAAAGAVVIVAAVFTVTPLVIAQIHTSGQQSPLTSSSATPKVTHSTAPAPSPSPTPSPTAAAPPPVPPNFAVSSVTFVSAGTGWVIGQAGTPGHCGPPRPFICTSIAITTDGGHTWQGSHAPIAGAPNGARGVSQIRSLNGIDAWAFGPQLYATHDGGLSWARIDTHGMRVVDLETVGNRAFAVWASCTGSGPDFAGHCTSLSLYSTPKGRDAWAPVPRATGLHASTGAPARAELALTGTWGYLLGPDNVLVTGPVSNPSAWHVLTGAGGVPVAAPCGPGPGGLSRQSWPGMLATTGPGLALLCPTPPSGTSRQGKTIYYSGDGGNTWQPAGIAPAYGFATSLSGTPNGPILVATTKGIYLSRTAPRGNGSLSWFRGQGLPAPGGYSFVGMTTDAQGVAIPAGTGLHAVWFTYDGGRHWQESPLP